ncbi:hypothetical protein ACPPVS_01485 [Cellulomonas sp. McL0617]|uniref:hypothetical protein n=1 Tax=Cellulomonas sp. McL0617 TaxID=3415675 RepID=UPI003CEF0899
MTITPTWKPADTEQGGRAFTATIGDVDVRVTFAGDLTGELAGDWEVRNALDDTLVLGGVDPALAGTRSAVQIYASLVSITDRLAPLLISAPEVNPAGVEYKLVKIVADDSDPTFARDVEATLGEHAAEGWRLVSVDRSWAYLERPVSA